MPLPAFKSDGDLLVTGVLLVTGRTYIANPSINNAVVPSGADWQARKLQHQHRCIVAHKSDETVTDEAYVVHEVLGLVGTLIKVACGFVVAPVGGDTVEIDVLVNGASIMVAPIELDAADSPYNIVTAAIDSAGLAVGDIIEVAINAVAAGGTPAKGVFAYVDLVEDFNDVYTA